jgi:glycerol-3-phosphate dehydrogenase subunit C
MKENFEVALKVGRPVAREANDSGARYVLSECPLARDHIVQGMGKLTGAEPVVEPMHHPIQVMARAYGL